MNQSLTTPQSSFCQLPYETSSGRLFSTIESLKYHRWANRDAPDLFARVRAIAIHYLLIPAAFGAAFIAAAISFLPSIVIQAKGQDPLPYLSFVGSHFATLGILFLTFPIRVLGYWAGKEEWLFPINFKEQRLTDRHPLTLLIERFSGSIDYVKAKWEAHTPLDDEALKQMSFKDQQVYKIGRKPNGLEQLCRQMAFSKRIDLSVRKVICQNKDVEMLCASLGTMNEDYRLDELGEMAVEMRSEEFANRWISMGRDINACWGERETLLSRTIQYAISSPERAEYIQYARFLMGKGALSFSHSNLWDAKDDLDRLQVLSELGFDVNTPEPSTRKYLLDHALRKGDERLIEFLFRKKARTSMTPSEIFTRLEEINNPHLLLLYLDGKKGQLTYWKSIFHVALDKQSRELVERLISLGWRIDEPIERGTPTLLSATMARAARDRSSSAAYLSFAEWLVKEQRARITQDCLNSAKEDLPSLQLLADQGADLNMIFGSERHTLLTYAVFNNKPEIVEFLLSRGVNKEIRWCRSERDFAGKTALQIAEERGLEEIIDLLRTGEPLEPPLDQFPPNLLRYEGKTLSESLKQVQGGVRKRDPWAVFGLKEGADRAAVERAFRKLSLTLHPDKNREELDFFSKVFFGVQEVRKHLLKLTS